MQQPKDLFRLEVVGDQHAIIQDMKRVAQELGHSPSRDEYLKHGRFSRHLVVSEFGSYSVLKQAAGLDEKPRKIDNTIFHRDIEKHLEGYEAKEAKRRESWPSLAAISDVHRPFQSERVVNRFLEYVGDVKPDYVCELGDGRDFLSHSRFAGSVNTFTPREENALGRKQHEDFWAEAGRRAPKSKRICMLGNHCVRPLRKTLEVYPAAEDWIAKAMEAEFTFPGVETILDHREEYVIDGDIYLLHGFQSGLGKHRDYFRQNCLVGHTHKGGVVWRTMANGQTIFEMNTGYAADPFSKGLSYTPTKFVDWTPGFGVINKYGPQFVSV